MNPLVNEQLGQATHREYETRYSRKSSPEGKENTENAMLSWQKLAIAAGSVATIIVFATLVFAG